MGDNHNGGERYWKLDLPLEVVFGESGLATSIRYFIPVELRDYVKQQSQYLDQGNSWAQSMYCYLPGNCALTLLFQSNSNHSIGLNWILLTQWNLLPIPSPCAQFIQRLKLKTSVWSKERFIDREGANQENGRPNGASNPSYLLD